MSKGDFIMPNVHSKNTKLIIDTSLSLFKARGYQNVSVNEICKTANISRSSFYAVFSGKKDIITYICSAKGFNQTITLHDFVKAENDFERIWNLCDHYLMLAEDFGPVLTGSLLSLEMDMDTSLGIYEGVHSIDEWLIKLMKNCQKIGLIQCSTPAELMIPITDSLTFQVIYDWCRCKGAFSLRERCRSYLEAVFDVAPEYRWI